MTFFPHRGMQRQQIYEESVNAQVNRGRLRRAYNEQIKDVIKTRQNYGAHKTLFRTARARFLVTVEAIKYIQHIKRSDPEKRELIILISRQNYKK